MDPEHSPCLVSASIAALALDLQKVSPEVIIPLELFELPSDSTMETISLLTLAFWTSVPWPREDLGLGLGLTVWGLSVYV